MFGASLLNGSHGPGQVIETPHPSKGVNASHLLRIIWSLVVILAVSEGVCMKAKLGVIVPSFG